MRRAAHAGPFAAQAPPRALVVRVSRGITPWVWRCSGALVMYSPTTRLRPGRMLLPWSGYLDHLKQGDLASNSAPISAADAGREADKSKAKASRRCCVFPSTLPAPWRYGRLSSSASSARQRRECHQRTSGVWNVQLGTWRSVHARSPPSGFGRLWALPSPRLIAVTLPSVIPAERLILLLNLGHTTSDPQTCGTNAMRGAVERLLVSRCCGLEEIRR